MQMAAVSGPGDSIERLSGQRKVCFYHLQEGVEAIIVTPTCPTVPHRGVAPGVIRWSQAMKNVFLGEKKWYDSQGIAHGSQDQKPDDADEKGLSLKRKCFGEKKWYDNEGSKVPLVFLLFLLILIYTD